MAFFYVISNEERESLSKAISRLTSIVNADSIPWEPNANDIHRHQAKEVLAELLSISPLLNSSPRGPGSVA